MSKASKLTPLVSEILFREWDPIGVNTYESCRDEYNSYVPTIVKMLLAGADVYKLTSYLSHLQSDSMGMSLFDEELHQKTARRLISLLK